MRVFALLFALWSLAAGQAVVEHAIITGGGSTAAAAGSKDASKSIGGVFGSLTKTLGAAGSSNSAATDNKPIELRTLPAPSGSKSYSPRTIQSGDVAVGMARSDLIEKCGKPFMKTSRVDGPQYVETYYYNGTDDVVVVTVSEGKVTAVAPPAPEEPKKSASL